jgi:hypothetical protein
MCKWPTDKIHTVAVLSGLRLKNSQRRSFPEVAESAITLSELLAFVRHEPVEITLLSECLSHIDLPCTFSNGCIESRCERGSRLEE